MSVALVLPAAGTGSRLGGAGPKLLHHVAGRPMIDHLARLYADRVSRWFIVCRPHDEPAIAEHACRLKLPATLVHQPEPIGMLDAVLRPLAVMARDLPDLVWITWCDQVAIHPLTVARLASTALVSPRPALAFPTSLKPSPYVHIERDADRRIVAIRHRRDGDVMPETGESDAGLFSLSRAAYAELLPQFDAASLGHERADRRPAERNFLPFIPWLQMRARVESFPCVDPMESVGVNTPDDLVDVERYLLHR